ncbi:vasotab-like [Chrysoperla carnea]|uniref:vasotab-like n=1 Tax=Chrysoperla carnea TaxID=189513 RepID=UPI001D07E6CE|nr:vasotab-like [Chrysoperla carnea]
MRFLKQLLVFVLIAMAMESVWGSVCPTYCPQNYSPVCGRNKAGQTKKFSNKCELNVANCKANTNEWRLC